MFVVCWMSRQSPNQFGWGLLFVGGWWKSLNGLKPIAHHRRCGLTGEKNIPRKGESRMRATEYKTILRPSIQYVEKCVTLMLNTGGVAEFLRVPRKKISYLVDTGRIPLPCRLGLGNCLRWSVLELLEWVEAGCPGRDKWIEMRGSSGWCPAWRW